MFKNVVRERTAALEKMQLMQFQRNYTSYRPSTIPGHLVDLADPKIALPNNSTLHTIGHFLNFEQTDSITPDISNVFIAKEQWPIYLQQVFDIPNAETRPFSVTDTYMLAYGRARAQAVQFFQGQRRIRRMVSRTSIERQQNVLVWYDYTPLEKIRVVGRFNDYRKFDIILRTVVNNAIASQSDRHHFIMLPMTDGILDRSRMLMPFKRLDQSAVKVHNDPSYFFMLHLLGMAYGRATPLDATPWPSDLHMWKESQEPMDEDAYLALSEDDREELLNGKYPGYEGKAVIESRKVWIFPKLRSTSILDRVEAPYAERINFVLTHNGKAIIYNLSDLQHFASTIPNFFQRILRHVNMLKMSGGHEDQVDKLNALSDDEFEDKVVEATASAPETASIPEPDENDTSADAIAARQDAKAIKDAEKAHGQHIEESPTDLETTLDEVIQPPPPKPDTPAAPVVADDFIKPEPASEPYTQAMQTTLRVKLASDERTTDSHYKRAETLMETHRNVRINGKTIAEYLEEAPRNSVNSNTLDFLKDEVPDASMMQSTLADMDKSYVAEQLHRDMAKVLTSFVGQGFFLVDLKETKTVDRFNRKTSYKAKFIDVNGKQHTVNYTLPDVDANGQMLLGGVVMRMVKQQVNLPICKISEDRVSISSNYNKIIVRRVKTVANNFSTYIVRHLNLLRRYDLVSVKYGSFKTGAIRTPFEYSTIAKTFAGVSAKGYEFFFDFDTRMTHIPEGLSPVVVESFETKYGVFSGISPNGSLLFWDMRDAIHVVSQDGSHHSVSIRFVDLLAGLFPEVPLPPMVHQWTVMELQGNVFPVMMVLCYQFGITETIKMLDLKYTFYPKGSRAPLGTTDLAIPFADGTMVFSRYPLHKSLVADGLKWIPTQKYNFSDLDVHDTYYDICRMKSVASNFLRGITEAFLMFVDPLTLDVLQRMNEPTTLAGLLLRATQMLSNNTHLPASSLAHHRLRGQERQIAMLYNEMARDMATYNNKRSPNKSYSINPKAVFERIRSDSSVINDEIINPMHEIKSQHNITFGGSGGRTSQAFVVPDRQYPVDAVGSISEATPDSGKVAMTVYASTDPRLANDRGMYLANPDNSEPVTPAQLLSPVSMLMPGVTQDDGKRANYVSIQMSHHVPCLQGEVSRMRTGFEKVIAHRTSEVFAVAAKSDGMVVDIDEKLKIAKVQYDDIPIVTSGSIHLGYPSTELATRSKGGAPLYKILTLSEIKKYHADMYLSLTSTLNVKIHSITPVKSLEGFADNFALKEAKSTAEALASGAIDTAYVVTMVITGKTLPGLLEAIQFEDRYTNVSGSYLKQETRLNVKAGAKVKRGDILAYNPGFFIPTPGSTQVSWKHGVMVDMAIMEVSATLEDGCLISTDLETELSMSPAHIRTVELDNKTSIRDAVEEGDEVESTDILCRLMDGDLELASGMSGVSTMSAFLSDLAQDTPRARYHGVVAEVAVYYACDFSDLHPSIQSLARKYDRKHKAIRSALVGTTKDSQHQSPGQVEVGLKYHGVDFEESTVIVEFTITEDLKLGQGDKIVVMNANKSVISAVMEKNPITESGRKLDMVFGTTSLYNRIVNSPFEIGGGNMVLEALEKDVLSIWDE